MKDTLDSRVAHDISDTALLRRLRTPEFQSHDLLQALSNLVAQMEEFLPTVETVVIDDVSGRLPGHFFYHYIRLARTSTGLRAPHAYYIAGGKDVGEHRQATITARLALLKDKKLLPGPVLFVTEHMSDGKGILPIMEIFDDVHVPTRICAVSQNSSYTLSEPVHSAIFEKRPFIGLIDSYCGVKAFWDPDNRDKNGVTKHSITSSHVKGSETLNHARIRGARGDMRSLAEVLYARYGG